MTLSQSLDVSADLSTYIKRDDLLAGPRKFRIAAVTRETFEQRLNSPAQRRIVLQFTDGRKFSLNKVNLQACAAAFGRDAALWIGKIVQLRFEPDVMMGGRAVGGVRLTAMPVAPTVVPPVAPVVVPAPPGPPMPVASADPELDDEPPV
jgi:hypothetical protein